MEAIQRPEETLHHSSSRYVREYEGKLWLELLSFFLRIVNYFISEIELIGWYTLGCRTAPTVDFCPTGVEAANHFSVRVEGEPLSL